MSVERVKKYFADLGMEGRVLEFETSSATVELAAQAVGCEPARIAKTLGFQKEANAAGCLLVVAAGDAKVDNRRFRDEFGFKARMLHPEDTPEVIGHAVGGVCPFAVNEGVDVYLDESLRRFETVFPAAGSSNSAIQLTMPELEKYSNFVKWVDVCKAWREDEKAKNE
jgi:prolyl-tRNA editing enzyme YbaK/EbsC (Cys-tRNA(Pro) deacylase)